MNSESQSQSPPELYCTAFRLRKATRRATQMYDHALAPFGLTVTQFGLLAMLERDGVMPIGQLADRAGMDRTSMTRTIRPLEAAGYVTLVRRSDDRRVRDVALTPKGNAIFTDGVRAWQTAQRHVNRTLGRDRIADLHGLLDAVSHLDEPHA